MDIKITTILIVILVIFQLIVAPGRAYSCGDNIKTQINEEREKAKKVISSGRKPAYEIAPKYGLGYKPVHENLCKSSLDKAGFGDKKDYLNSLKFGVFWNDDPLRKLWIYEDTKPDEIFASWALHFKSESPSFSHYQNTSNLIWRSHHGDLQFLHAMVSSETQNKEKTKEKIKKDIMGWAKFCYAIAIGDLDKTTALNNLYSKYPILNYFQEHIWRRQENGTILTAENLFMPNKPSADNVMIGDEVKLVNNKFDIKAVALGSLLHTVQDSYTTSHVDRSDDLKIEEFLYYSSQDKDEHRAADKVENDPNAIAHGAKIIQFAMTEESWDEVRKYLLKNVLSFAEPSAPTNLKIVGSS